MSTTASGSVRGGFAGSTSSDTTVWRDGWSNGAIGDESVFCFIADCFRDESVEFAALLTATAAPFVSSDFGCYCGSFDFWGVEAD